MKGGYQWWCKSCMKPAVKGWSIENKEHLQKRNHQWHIDNLDRRKAARSKREKERWKNDQGFRDRKNQIKAERRKIRLENESGYIEKLRAWGRAHAFNRRTKQHGVKNAFKESQWPEILKQYNHRCAYCGKENARLERDHMIPLARGGDHVASNIAPACRWCNAHKATMTDTEFREYLREHPRK